MADDWHPCDEGIIPIAEALSRLASRSHPTFDEVRCQSTSPLSVLASAFNEPGLGPRSGSASRREMVRGWLEFFVPGGTAHEFDARLQSVRDALRSWEDRARRPSEWYDDPFDREIELATGLSRRLWDGFLEIQDQAHEAADYLRRLDWMIRSRARRGVDGVTRTTAGLAAAVTCSEPTITRWARLAEVERRSGSGVLFDPEEAKRILEYGREHARERRHRRKCRELLGV